MLSSMAVNDAGAHSPAPRKGITALYLAAVIVFWGGNWLLMKLVLPQIAPLTFVSIRVSGAAAVTGMLLLVTGKPLLPPPDERGGLAGIGLLQIAAMLGLSIVGLAHVNAGRAIVLAYTMQLWAVPLGWWLVGERFGLYRVIGSSIGFSGLILYSNPRLVDWHDGAALAGNMLILAGAIGWALGACLYRRRTWRSDFWTQTWWQLVVSSVPLTFAAVVSSGRPVVWNSMLLAVLLFNWFIATALAYWCWAKVLRVMSASAAGQYLMLTPIFGYLLSAATFGDPLTPDVVASIVLIIIGLGFTFQSDRSRPRS